MIICLFIRSQMATASTSEKAKCRTIGTAVCVQALSVFSEEQGGLEMGIHTCKGRGRQSLGKAHGDGSRLLKRTRAAGVVFVFLNHRIGGMSHICYLLPKWLQCLDLGQAKTRSFFQVSHLDAGPKHWDHRCFCRNVSRRMILKQSSQVWNLPFGMPTLQGEFS